MHSENKFGEAVGLMRLFGRLTLSHEASFLFAMARWRVGAEKYIHAINPNSESGLS